MGKWLGTPYPPQSPPKWPETEAEFIRLMKSMFNDVYLPLINETIKREVNEQLRAVTDKMVASVIKK